MSRLPAAIGLTLALPCLRRPLKALHEQPAERIGLASTFAPSLTIGDPALVLPPEHLMVQQTL